MPRPTVILRDCSDYDPERIRRIVREGMETLDLRPTGRTLVKPNIVAAGEFFSRDFCETDYAGLGCNIIRLSLIADHTDNRRYVNYPAILLLHHCSGNYLHTGKGAL